jgi:hypothetical protein
MRSCHAFCLLARGKGQSPHGVKSAYPQQSPQQFWPSLASQPSRITNQTRRSGAGGATHQHQRGSPFVAPRGPITVWGSRTSAVNDRCQTKRYLICFASLAPEPPFSCGGWPTSRTASYCCREPAGIDQSRRRVFVPVPEAGCGSTSRRQGPGRAPRCRSLGRPVSGPSG